jgi:putative membrane protein
VTPPPTRRKPRAFTVDQAAPQPGPDLTRAPPLLDAELPAPTTPRPRPRRGWRWGWVLVAALAGLAMLAAATALTDYVGTLFQRGGAIGWIALSLAGLAGLALLVVTAREIIGFTRLARLRRLREAADAAVLSDASARRIIADLLRLYAGRPELGPASAEVVRHTHEIVDPPDRLAIVERALMATLDAEAGRLIGDAAKRVSLVTAISPAAIIDLGVVLITQLALIRRIAELYGGRPGTISLLRLARLVIAHLAVTGSIALGDDVIQQLIGHGLAARLSARLGEGVLNGLMTARVGIAALDVCRPLPFRALKQPKVTDFAWLARTTVPAQ